MKGHRERLDALVAPIPTPFATPVENIIIEALRAAALEWKFEQINFVAGRRGAVVEDDFYNNLKLEKLHVQAGKRDKILLAHV